MRLAYVVYNFSEPPVLVDERAVDEGVVEAALAVVS